MSIPKPVHWLLLPLLGIFFLTSAMAESDNQHLAEDVVYLSSMGVQISQIPDAIRKGFDASVASGELEGQFPADVLPAVRAGLVQAFDPEMLLDIVIATLAEELSATDFTLVIEWHKSSLGARIAAMEQSRSLLTHGDESDEFFQALRKTPPSMLRLQALSALQTAWQVTEASVDMMIDMQVAVSAAIVSTLPAELQLPLPTLVEAYSAQKDSLIDRYTTETLISMLYIYNGLSIEDIDRYTAFMMTDSGNRYMQATNLAMRKAMLEGSYGLGKGIGGLIGSRTDQHTL